MSVDKDYIRIHITSADEGPISVKGLARILNRIDKNFENFCKNEHINGADENSLQENPYKLTITAVKNGSIWLKIAIFIGKSIASGLIEAFAGYLVNKCLNNGKRKDRIEYKGNGQFEEIIDGNDPKLNVENANVETTKTKNKDGEQNDD